VIFIVFSIVLWVSILLNQVLVTFPFQLLHVFNLPPMLGLAVLLGIFAWIFGD
jgi:hypothetical protein